MKKVNALVLVLAVLLAFGCGGDDPEPAKNCRLIKRTLEYNNNGYTEKHTDVATVNAQGQILEVLHKFANSTTTSIRGKSEFIYNGAGQLIRKNYYPGTEPRLMGFSTFKYNGAGLMEAQKVYVILTDTIESMREFYEYDPENRLKRRYVDTSRTVYFDYAYQGNNKVTIKNIFIDSTNKEAVNFIEEIEFDSKRASGAGSYFHSDVNFPVQYHDFGHNVVQRKTTNMTWSVNNGVITYTYKYNSNNYPESWTTTNSLTSGITSSGTYEYDCQ